MTYRLVTAAWFAVVIIAIILATFQVQEWTMPTFLAVPLLVILFLMLIGALGIIGFEFVKGIRVP